MNKKLFIVGMLSATLALPLTACGGSSSAASSAVSTEATAGAPSADAVKFFSGQWRGSVEITGQTVYGTAGGSEQMLDVIFNEDGTCKVTPMEAHADLMNAEGTWEGDDKSATLHLSSGDIKLTVVDDATLSGNAKDFGIADFDTITFDFYG